MPLLFPLTRTITALQIEEFLTTDQDPQHCSREWFEPRLRAAIVGEQRVAAGFFSSFVLGRDAYVGEGAAKRKLPPHSPNVVKAMTQEWRRRCGPEVPGLPIILRRADAQVSGCGSGLLVRTCVRPSAHAAHVVSTAGGA